MNANPECIVHADMVPEERRKDWLEWWDLLEVFDVLEVGLLLALAVAILYLLLLSVRLFLGRSEIHSLGL